MGHFSMLWQIARSRQISFQQTRHLAKTFKNIPFVRQLSAGNPGLEEEVSDLAFGHLHWDEPRSA